MQLLTNENDNYYRRLTVGLYVYEKCLSPIFARILTHQMRHENTIDTEWASEVIRLIFGQVVLRHLAEVALQNIA